MTDKDIEVVASLNRAVTAYLAELGSPLLGWCHRLVFGDRQLRARLADLKKWIQAVSQRYAPRGDPMLLYHLKNAENVYWEAIGVKYRHQQ